MKINTHTILTAMASIGMIGSSGAAVIYEANDSNVSLWNNSAAISGSSSSVSGDSASGDMALTVTGNSFSYAGFASTQSINTLLGRSLLDSETVTLTFTTGVLSQNGDGGELRSQGFQMGLSASTAVDGGASEDQLIISLGGGGNSSDVGLKASANAGPASGGGFEISKTSANDGLTITIVADSSGWTASFSDVSAEAAADSVADLTGSFDPGEFTSFFGNGYLYAGFQQRNGGVNGVTVPFEVASIDVVPEPSSSALLGLGGLALILRRRK
ncbi:PEP-CTERM sorting domain-containing protein [Verrucomicrobiaceae bacterium R5-34]|nr:PEP-CTERM sorting domain-containing protein [Verrucomicrobiaceae bacterium R5-34]